MRKYYVTSVVALSIAGLLQGCAASLHSDAAKRLEDASDWPGAIAEYKLALNEPANKNNAQLKLSLAKCYVAISDWKNGEDACKASIDSDSKVPETHIVLAQCYLKESAKNEALEQYNMAAQLDEKSAVPLIEAGKILDSNGDSKGALAKYEAAVKADDNSADAHEAYSKALSLAGNGAKANTEMARAEDLRKNPPKPKAQ